MQRIVVDKNICPENHSCPSIRVCPKGAMVQNGYLAPEIDMNKCILCGKCIRFCPLKAIKIIEED